ncbi:methylmalonyl-CoA mutase subunit beta [Croceitalea sp. MTPC9]|uniref:methylmalonyl-CoA mutase subunit beta n=1 Tax=unclassified Croceitalea TaxID=2632280 RepID=UPI002B38DCE1|nr:methylmalonyl-CoA mutase subunit beta [Croceitalea sp. MTPC6]GMN16169.1 methylmalonyl-CoA mutase subunit beta [Croceitalea sp. MTPC9]
MSNKKLFSDFQEVSAKAWKQKIQVDLKGADYNETLVWESPEGIKVKPFYHQEDMVASNQTISKENSSWKIGHTIYAGNAIMANGKALEFLERGVESILFIVPSKEIEIRELLKGIDIEMAPVYFELQFLSSNYVKEIVEVVGEAADHIFINIDIIGNLAKSGNWFDNLGNDHQVLETMLETGLPNALQVDVSLYQNAGANIVQQLAYALAHANEYLNHFKDVIASAAQRSVVFTFKVAIGTNYFFEIAKLRSLRLLWKTLAAEYGMTADCHIMAQPTQRNKTLYDYNTNMLRTTTESMSAVLGGADVVFNAPYDAIYHKTNEFGDRIAINQLLLLKNEGHLDKVDNAADGAYYIENLTRQLAEKALELFKSIEKSGGFLRQLKDHTIQKKIKESAEKEQAKFDAEEEVLVGTNKFQNPNDRMMGDLELYPFVKTNARKTLIEPIIERRLAEALEQKRLDDE